MKGRIIDYSTRENKGIISAEDGRHYEFSGANWRATQTPTLGMKVEFDLDNDRAGNVYFDVAYLKESTKQKNRVVAGLLAIFLGFWGVHKFYLGMFGAGLVFLLINTIGFAVTKAFGRIPNYALIVIAILEGIVYLSKSDDDFHSLYVEQKKTWF